MVLALVLIKFTRYVLNGLPLIAGLMINLPPVGAVPELLELNSTRHSKGCDV
jgi:hypothetical protein